MIQSGAGVELERGPVVGLFVDTVLVEKGKLGGAEGGIGVFAAAQLAVEGIHELRSGAVADFPDGADDVVCTGPEEGPGKTDHAFAGVNPRARAVTGGDGH